MQVTKCEAVAEPIPTIPGGVEPRVKLESAKSSPTLLTFFKTLLIDVCRSADNCGSNRGQKVARNPLTQSADSGFDKAGGVI